MFLNYLALFLIMLSITAIFYLFIYIHDLPHQIAKQREHPHEEAIHVACWLSLFTLHAMWPLVFTWAVSHKKEAHVPKAPVLPPAPVPIPVPVPVQVPGQNGELMTRLVALEQRLQKLEASAK